MDHPKPAVHQHTTNMHSHGPAVKKVLFVDDSSSFLNMLERVFGVWCHGSWQMIKAEDGPRGLALLNQFPIHAIVIDLLMPGMDGLEFLRIAHKRYPQIPKVMLTGFPGEATRIECLEAGAVLYLEKPDSMEGMEGVYSTIDELVKSQVEGGFKGMMHHVGLSEVLQVECLNRNSSVLEVTSGKIQGHVYVRNGEIIHARVHRFKGTMALSFLLALKGGEFVLKPFTAPPEITVGGSWEALLLEAAQFRDESDDAIFASATTALPRHSSSLEELPPLEIAHSAQGDLIALGDGAYDWTGPSPARLGDFLTLLRQRASDLPERLGQVEHVDIQGDNYRLIVESRPEGGIRIQVYRTVEEPRTSEA